MKRHTRYMALSAAVTSLLLPVVADATNGAWLIGFGGHSRSMGGTGVADNRGGMAAAFNPATMIDSGTRFDLGAEIFVPPRAIKHNSTRLGYTDERSETDIFLIPSMGGTWQWKKDIALGFAFIGAGLKTEYNQSATNNSCNQVNAGNVPTHAPGSCPPTVFNTLGQPDGTGQIAGREAGVELIQMQMSPSIAYKVNETHTIAASLVLAAQYFRAEGLEDFGPEGLKFTSGAGNNLSGGHWDQSFGAGLKFGWLGKFQDEKLKVGVNYSSRVYMSEFESYSDLFAEQGDFDIPESYAIGFAYDFTPAVTVAFDVQQINWSNVKSIGNPGPNAADPDNLFVLCPAGTPTDPCKLGGDKGLGFGWDNQTVYKIGADWAFSKKMNFRAGWNYGKAPIPNDQVLFNMLAPATPEHHLTMGMGYAFTETLVLDASFVYAFNNTIKGPTAFGPDGGALVTGSNASISMVQYSLGATLGYKF